MRVRKLEEYFSTHKNHICLDKKKPHLFGLDKNSLGRKKVEASKKGQVTEERFWH